MFRDRIVELIRVPARELQPHPLNWRKHPQRQRTALRAALAEVGYAAPTVAQRMRDGTLRLIDGHERADLDPNQMIPVVVLDVTDAEAEMLLASMDPIGALASTNEEALARLLDGIETKTADLADFLGTLAPRLGMMDEDDIPDLPAKPKSKAGDLFALGDHLLLCGDATSPKDLARLLPEPADALVTDPPYGVDYEGKTSKRLTIQGDTAKGLDRLLETAFASVAGHLVDGAPAYCFSPSGPQAEVFMHSFGKAFRMRQTLIWVKNSIVLGHSDYMYQHEIVLLGYAGIKSRGRGRSGWYGGDNQSSVIEVPKPRRSDEHPTAKPLALIRRLLENSTRRGQLVLDPFAGSGSLLLACEQTGRRAALVEIDPAYCDVIIRRFEAHTNTKARRIK